MESKSNVGEKSKVLYSLNSQIKQYESWGIERQNIKKIPWMKMFFFSFKKEWHCNEQQKRTKDFWLLSNPNKTNQQLHTSFCLDLLIVIFKFSWMFNIISSNNNSNNPHLSKRNHKLYESWLQQIMWINNFSKNSNSILRLRSSAQKEIFFHIRLF